MKGIILNITEQFLKEKFGEDLLAEVRNDSVLSTQTYFSGPGTYPDADWMELVHKASAILRMTVIELQISLGNFTFMQLAEKFPQFVTPYKHPKDFLLTVEHMIHVDVRKMYADSNPPRFLYADNSANELTITYISERKLYAFMEGILNGVQEYFKVPFMQEQFVYIEDGVEQCDFRLTFMR